MDTERASSVPASFVISPPLRKVVIALSAATKPKKPRAKSPALPISPRLSCPASFATPTIINIETDTDNNNLLKPSIVFPPKNLEMISKIVTKPRNAPANATPFFASFSFNLLASFTTPTISPIETTIDFTILPTESILSPARFDIAKYAITNPKNTPAKLRPFSTSSTDSILNNLMTPTISNMVLPILLIIFPALSMFLAASPFTSSPYMNKIPVIPSNRRPAHFIP